MGHREKPPTSFVSALGQSTTGVGAAGDSMMAMIHEASSAGSGS